MVWFYLLLEIHWSCICMYQLKFTSNQHEVWVSIFSWIFYSLGRYTCRVIIYFHLDVHIFFLSSLLWNVKKSLWKSLWLAKLSLLQVPDQDVDVWTNSSACVPDALRRYYYQYLSSTTEAAEVIMYMYIMLLTSPVRAHTLVLY